MSRLEQSVIETIYKSVLRFLGPLSLEETYIRIVNEAIRLVKGQYGLLLFRQEGEFVKIYSSSEEGYKSRPQKKAYLYQAALAFRIWLHSEQ